MTTVANTADRATDFGRALGPCVKHTLRTLDARAYSEADIAAVGTLQRRREGRRVPRRQLVALFALAATAGAR